MSHEESPPGSESFNDVLSEILTPAPPGKKHRVPETGRPAARSFQSPAPPKLRNRLDLAVRLAAAALAVLLLLWFAMMVAGR